MPNARAAGLAARMAAICAAPGPESDLLRNSESASDLLEMTILHHIAPGEGFDPNWIQYRARQSLDAAGREQYVVQVSFADVIGGNSCWGGMFPSEVEARESGAQFAICALRCDLHRLWPLIR